MKWKQGRLHLHGRGRPAGRSDRSERQSLLLLIELLGPGVGVPTLQALCPRMARREVQDLLRRYRKIWKRRRRLLSLVLHWLRPGSVWAMDFAAPPLPIDGTYERLLAVRDLASGMQLLWLPVADESAATAIAALEALFRQHGPPHGPRIILPPDSSAGG
jgi:transposase InsO family protein